MSTVTIVPATSGLVGTVAVPGDKSIAHRGLLLGAVAQGTTRLTGFPGGADNLATAAACRALGVGVDVRGGEVVVEGRGWDGLQRPAATLDCRNSGTTMRLLTGLLAGRPFTSRLDGDASLRRRPMRRVIDPLTRMGAAIRSEGAGGCAPLVIDGRPLRGVAHVLPIASAQVKSAVVLAGLQARGRTTVSEPARSRDHTERLLAAFGARLTVVDHRVEVEGPQELRGQAVTLPGDFSSAAFLIVAALVVPGSVVTVRGVGLNPTRTGLLDALAAMGATLEVAPGATAAEPLGTVVARSARLHGAAIGGELLLRAIDEFPVLCVAAACAEGTTEFSGAGELRVKESDRITSMAAVLRAFGAAVEERPDGMAVHGPARLGGARIDARGDHRVAMAAAVAALASREGATIAGAECAEVSFPGFYATLDGLRVGAGSGRASRPAARRRLVIAIDGPAGAGKGTTARALAARLGYVYYDSGVLYRAVGLAARERGVDPADASALAAMVDGLAITVEEAADGPRVVLDGRDVTPALRAPEAGEWASRVAAVPQVRARLMARQRAAAAAGGVVMDGRDIGTVVLPDADCKFYLEASVAERARRRQAETPGESLAAVRAAIEARDRRDAERPVAPLRAAEDAVVVDTTARTPEEVVAVLLQTVAARARP